MAGHANLILILFLLIVFVLTQLLLVHQILKLAAGTVSPSAA